VLPATIVARTPGIKARVSGNRLRSQVKEKGLFRFSVLHSTRKSGSARVTYQFTVVD